MRATHRRILIVAHGAVRDSSLLEAVADRARRGPARFTLLVPAVAHGLHRMVDPEDHPSEEAEMTLDAALPVLSEAAGAPITGMIGSHDPFAAAWDALNMGAYDEVIVSARSNRLSRLLRFDLPRRIATLGVPVTVAGDHHGQPRAAGRLAEAA